MSMRQLLCEELRNAGFTCIDGVWKKDDLWVYDYKVLKDNKQVMDLLEDYHKSVEWIRTLFSVNPEMDLHDEEVLIRVGGELHILACFDMGKGYDAWLDRKQVWDNRNKTGDKVVHKPNKMREVLGDDVNYFKIWLEATRAQSIAKKNQRVIWEVK